MQRRFLRKRGAAVSVLALSVFALQIHTPPFVTYGDIFPRRGGSLSSKGEPLAKPETLPLPLKPSPWGRWIAAQRQDGRGLPGKQLSALAANFPAMPKAPSQRELSKPLGFD